MRAKKKQLQRQTEAQKAVDQNVEGWRQLPKPSKFLVITALVCFLGFLLMASLWANAMTGDKFIGAGYCKNQINYLTEAYYDRIYTTNEMMQLLMQELDWPVDLEDDQWWFDCREQLELE